MAGMTFQITGVTQFASRMKAFDDAAKRSMIAGGHDAQQAVVDRAIAILQVSGKVPPTEDTQHLRNSGHVEDKVNKTNARSDAIFGGPDARYAVVVHEGRAAGSRPPPIKPIADWAERHGIDPGAAFAIAEAIGEHGIDPVKFLERAFDERRDLSMAMLAHRVANGWQTLSG